MGARNEWTDVPSELEQAVKAARSEMAELRNELVDQTDLRSQVRELTRRADLHALLLNGSPDLNVDPLAQRVAGLEVAVGGLETTVDGFDAKLDQALEAKRKTVTAVGWREAMRDPKNWLLLLFTLWLLQSFGFHIDDFASLLR